MRRFLVFLTTLVFVITALAGVRIILKSGRVIEVDVDPSQIAQIVFVPERVVYGNIYYYWIQDREKVWIKGDWMGEKVLYVYYGVVDGNPRYRWENGDNVFEFWDDFEDYMVSQRKWNLIGANPKRKFYVAESHLVLPEPDYNEYDLDQAVYHELDLPSCFTIFFKMKVIKNQKIGMAGMFLSRYKPINPHKGLLAFGATDIGKFGIQELRDSEHNWDVIANIPEDYSSFYIWEIDFYKNNIYTTVISNDRKVVDRIFYETSVEAQNFIIIGVTYSGITLYIDYIFVIKYSPAHPSIEYAPEENGTWQIGDYTFTKRRKVIVRSSKPLKDFQIALDFSKFNDERLMIVEENQ